MSVNVQIRISDVLSTRVRDMIEARGLAIGDLIRVYLEDEVRKWEGQERKAPKDHRVKEWEERYEELFTKAKEVAKQWDDWEVGYQERYGRWELEVSKLLKLRDFVRLAQLWEERPWAKV